MDYSDAELRGAMPPLVSLLSKSEKAQQKLAPGTWQHTMLRDNIKALRMATALMPERTAEADGFSRDDLVEALRALASMIGRAEKAMAGFSPGTSHHTLQHHRVEALRIAEALTQAEMDRRFGTR